MTRPVSEWRGARPETTTPPRVKLRILAHQGDCCTECGRSFSAPCRPEFGHVHALMSGSDEEDACCNRNGCGGTMGFPDASVKF